MPWYYAVLSGLVMLALTWGAWEFLNKISPCDDDD